MYAKVVVGEHVRKYMDLGKLVALGEAQDALDRNADNIRQKLKDLGV
jgi:hypothetical protein